MYLLLKWQRALTQGGKKATKHLNVIVNIAFYFEFWEELIIKESLF